MDGKTFTGKVPRYMDPSDNKAKEEESRKRALAFHIRVLFEDHQIKLVAPLYGIAMAYLNDNPRSILSLSSSIYHARKKQHDDPTIEKTTDDFIREFRVVWRNDNDPKAVENVLTSARYLPNVVKQGNQVHEEEAGEGDDRSYIYIDDDDDDDEYEETIGQDRTNKSYALRTPRVAQNAAGSERGLTQLGGYNIAPAAPVNPALVSNFLHINSSTDSNKDLSTASYPNANIPDFTHLNQISGHGKRLRSKSPSINQSPSSPKRIRNDFASLSISERVQQPVVLFGARNLGSSGGSSHPLASPPRLLRSANLGNTSGQSGALVPKQPIKDNNAMGYQDNSTQTEEMPDNTEDLKINHNGITIHFHQNQGNIYFSK
ncbi:hypothetical protein ABW19_dt0209000 [Dactylella cylindrospora]|nr:hypothetical protein ABW19_dt0209000 [Dactylella cylindrospora]